MMPSLLSLAALAMGAFNLAHAKLCPPLGAVFPAPEKPSESRIVQNAAEQLKKALESEAKANFNASAVAIQVKSIHEDKPLLSLFYTPPKTGTGANKVDEKTVFRIASGTKMFAVLAALQHSDIDMNASVLKYLPELAETENKDPIYGITWDEVTVGSLAGHLSGVGVDSAQDLGIAGSNVWKAKGLPEFPKDKGPSCSGLPSTTPCSRRDLLTQVNLRPPVYESFTNPIYSNIGIALIGLVVEAATKKPFAKAVKEQILDIANLKRTYVGEVPNQKDVFISEGEAIWNNTLEVFEPAGGMYSCSADMVAFWEGIYTNKFLSAKQTRQWMKPGANTASWGYQVGEPWEILRTDNLTSDGRIIDVYTKSGDLGLYHNLHGIVADYDLIVSVMTAGQEVSANPFVTPTLFSKVLQGIIPAIEKVSRDEAKRDYAGTYSDESTNSSITFQVDNGPGLKISQWQVRGYDVLRNINGYSVEGISSTKPPAPLADARVYPTNLENNKAEQAWRAVFDPFTDGQDAAFDAGLFARDGSCQTWFQQDRKVYDFLALDEFVFQGGAEAVHSPGFQVTMKKVRSSSPGEDGSGSGTKPESTPHPSAVSTSGTASGRCSVVGVAVVALGASLPLAFVSLF